jgi:DNA modification methylase
VTLDLHTQGFLDALGRIDARKEKGKTMKVKAEVIIGDNRQALKELPDASVQTVVTSPPYWGLRDYGTATWIGGDESCDHETPRSRGADIKADDKQGTSKGSRPNLQWDCKCGAIREDNQIGLEQSPDDFIEQLCVVFDEVWRVLKDDGTIWVNLGDSYSAMRDSKASPDSLRTGEGTRVGSAANRNPENLRKAGLKHKDLVGIPWRFAFAMQARGWYLRSDIIWHKPNPMPESVTDRPTKSHEYIFLMTKSSRYYYDHEAIKEPASDESMARMKRGVSDSHKNIDGAPGQTKHSMNQAREYDPSRESAELRNKRTVWTISTKPYKEAHFATYPSDLIQPCILAGSKEGDTVLDPFSGSGTTGEVALKHGRNYIGLELNPDYAAISEKRITDAVGMFAELEMRNATLQENDK